MSDTPDVNPWDEPTTVMAGPQVSEPLNAPVNITLKGGKGYEAPWITFPSIPLRIALQLFAENSDDIIKLQREVAGASQEFQKQCEKFGVAGPARSYGKPAGADKPAEPAAAQDTSVPFDDPGATEEQPMMACEHGVRKLVEHGGKRGHVCPLPPKTPGRCAPIFA